MTDNTHILIALAEDNAINRNTFLQKIGQLKGYKLSFMAKNGNECLEELKGLPFPMLPKIIFMDIEMPELDGIQTIAIAKSLYPQIHFIVLTVFDDDEKIFDAIKSGASGYLLKHESAAVLEEAILNVLNFEGAPMSPSIARKALQLLSRSVKENDTRPGTGLPAVITDREKEILQQMISGWDAKRIAAALNISVLTVRKHIANIYDKLHVNSKAQVISLAHKNNWLK
ncbi:MAG: response regulator transcription factor [Candidatus Pseudobacter hemicellulosilyticus]|uniref:Response regulator transcription factor n=1 Tax=Candidatus Pseudobacter hemicellulosilyticus TaxID=3121375 RepID=A0AAJ6BG76_9BACT|nr:MAG: response regulator transcription factor [Pseudobacter sp.]